MNAPYGRRGLPPDAEDPETTPSMPRRGVLEPAPEPPADPDPVPSGPRRGIVEDDPEPPSENRRAWLWMAVLGVAIALMVGVLWLVFGGRGALTTVPQSPPATAPTSSPTSAPGTTPGVAPMSAPTTEPAPPSEPATTAPDQPVPSSVPPTAASPDPTPTGQLITLDDGATFTLPTEWELYADEQVQNGRRLVRIREVATDVRIQAVSLTTVTGPLDEACLDLIADHRRLYSDVAEGLPVTVPISGEGEGVSCNFTGTRTSDDVAASVEFTLLQLGGSTLVFRDTIPTALPDDAAARTQLVAMECQAAEGFGVLVDQCALTPARGDG